MQVFADFHSSHNPIKVPRNLIWDLQTRTVFFGTSVPTIFRGKIVLNLNKWKFDFFYSQNTRKQLYSLLSFLMVV